MSKGFFTTDALVLREVRYKEADRILTLFTSSDGKVTAKAASALRKTSKLSASTQLLTLSEMTLFENKGRISVKEAVIKESFGSLREDFSNYALGCYFAECIEALSEENTPDAELMQLILNSLYALGNNLHDPLLIKAAFELRLACILGYTPDLDSCAVCGKEKPESPVLGTQTGRVCCRNCRNASVGITAYLDDASLNAMKHIVSAPPKRLYPQDLEGESLKKLSDACEAFFLEMAGRSFSTLSYWKKVK